LAAFLALMAIRGGVKSSDAFSRFWNQAMAGRTEIAIAVDAGEGASISPAMADAALPLAALANALQAPVHIIAAGSKTPPAKCCAPRPPWQQRWQTGDLVVGGERGDAAVGRHEFVVALGVSGDALRSDRRRGRRLRPASRSPETSRTPR
jgi:hypothetical protein